MPARLINLARIRRYAGNALKPDSAAGTVMEPDQRLIIAAMALGLAFGALWTGPEKSPEPRAIVDAAGQQHVASME